MLTSFITSVFPANCVMQLRDAHIVFALLDQAASYRDLLTYFAVNYLSSSVNVNNVKNIAAKLHKLLSQLLLKVCRWINSLSSRRVQTASMVCMKAYFSKAKALVLNYDRHHCDDDLKEWP